MADEPRRNGSLRRVRSTGDIVGGVASIGIPEGTPSTRDRRVFSAHGQTNPHAAPDSSASGARNPSEEVRNDPMQRASQPQAPAIPPPLRQDPPVQQVQRHRRLTVSRIKAFFGLGRNASPQRKLNMSLIQGLAWNIAQIVIVVTMLVLTSTYFRSTANPHLSEWTACDRPLGIWSCIWVLRGCLSIILKIWEYKRNITITQRANDEETRPNTTSNGPSQAEPHPPNTSNMQLLPTVNSTSTHQSSTTQTPNDSPERTALQHSRLYSRMALLSSLLTLTWFLTAHIFEYTSTKTCRLTSPHLWWLVFGILSIMYLVVLEVLILGVFVFVIGPILYLVWSLILIALGRHPLQNPNLINPEISKLPSSVVDQIPLVMYIPPPPVGFNVEELTKPEATYSYPPKPPISKPTSRPKFRLLRGISFGERKDTASDPASPKSDLDLENQKGLSNWERNWENSELPFVILEDNRAACAICLNDFEAPKKKTERTKESERAPPPEGSSAPSQVPPNTITEEERDSSLRLEDAGEGAQPLRLLQCGHVFHKTCLDPWLTNISGRCPVCQKAVELPPEGKKGNRRRRRRSTTR